MFNVVSKKRHRFSVLPSGTDAIQKFKSTRERFSSIESKKESDFKDETDSETLQKLLIVNAGVWSHRSTEIDKVKPEELIKPYNHADLFNNIDKIDFAEPIMMFGDEEVSAKQKWLEVSKRVFDGDREHKINRYKKAEN